jgi:hypothetical protein
MAGPAARLALIAAGLSFAVLSSGCAAWRDEPLPSWTALTARNHVTQHPAAIQQPAPAPRREAAALPDPANGPEDFHCLDGSHVRVSHSEARDTVSVSLDGASPVAMQRADEMGLTAYRSAGLVLRRAGPRIALSSDAASVIVESGDTLSLIAIRHYGDRTRAMEIARLNDIANPDLIHPGQVLRLPVAERRCRRMFADAASYAAGPAASLERRTFSPPSRRQPDLRRIRATASDPD